MIKIPEKIILRYNSKQDRMFLGPESTPVDIMTVGDCKKVFDALCKVFGEHEMLEFKDTSIDDSQITYFLVEK